MKVMRGLLLATASVSLTSFCLAAPGAPQNTVNTLEDVKNDMALSGEVKPHGNPWHWATQPRLTLGINPGQYRAAIAWGAVYEAADGNPSNNTRVELSNMRLLVLSKHDHAWRALAASTAVKGFMFREDFKDNVKHVADLRAEPDGGRSVRPGGGRCFHFWPMQGRVPIAADDIAGIISTFEARLVKDDPAGPDDRATARFVAAAGGDYWLNVSVLIKPEEGVNTKVSNEIGIGRFKQVTATWRAFNMSTLTPAQLASHPPPLDPPPRR